MPIMTCSAILSTDENTNGVFSAPVAVYEAEFRGPAIVFFRADSNEASEREVGARRGGPGCRRVLSLRADVGDLRLVEKFYVFVLYPLLLVVFSILLAVAKFDTLNFFR